MKKVGKIKIYDNWNGIIMSEGKNYVFRKDDVDYKKAIVGDEVTFVSEVYSKFHDKDPVLVARFINKKESK